MQNFDKSHVNYSLFACMAEFLISFSINLLPSLHLQNLGVFMSLGMFALYFGISVIHCRRLSVVGYKRSHRKMAGRRFELISQRYKWGQQAYDEVV